MITRNIPVTADGVGHIKGTDPDVLGKKTIDVIVSAEGYLSKNVSVSPKLNSVKNVTLYKNFELSKKQLLDEASWRKNYIIDYTDYQGNFNTEIDNIFASLGINPKDTTQSKYDNVYKCYSWIFKNIYYEQLKKEDAGRIGDYRSNYWGRGLYCLKNRHGCCIEYSIVFAAMLRKLGIKSFVMGDELGHSDAKGNSQCRVKSATGGFSSHVWVMVDLIGNDEKYYIFDVQVEQVSQARTRKEWSNEDPKRLPTVLPDPLRFFMLDDTAKPAIDKYDYDFNVRDTMFANFDKYVNEHGHFENE